MRPSERLLWYTLGLIAYLLGALWLINAVLTGGDVTCSNNAPC